jgi:hypothetical protein
MAGKPTRINQLAAECNISVDTIIQHLAANGFKGDEFTATKKLDSAQVDMITAQFASDHAQKEDVKKLKLR